MKTLILIGMISGLLCWNLRAQTADEWITQGLSDLSVQDLTDANTSFAQALVASSTNEDANALYAITSLLVLPYQPSGSNFLTRIGVPLAGRNIYAWKARPPEDANGLLLAPAGVNADEFTAQFRTNVLLAVSGAISNLAVVSETNFTITLTGSETASTGVTVDYGDLKLIQAGLYASEYFIYTLNAQNLNAQLSDLRALYTGGILSAGQVLADYPQLFTFATTNDLQSARAAFTNAVNCYLVASAFIRARPSGEVRLFNYDEVSATEEADFRLTLQNLEDSLTLGPQVLSLNANASVDLTPTFSGTTDLRSLLPKFDGNAIELGSLPDPTFGGAVDGLTRGDVESYLGNYLTMLPVGSAPAFLSANTVQIAFTTLNGHDYVLQTSTNLLDWELVTNFAADDAISALVYPENKSSPQNYYRLRDDTGFMAFSGVVLDQNTGLPIPGALISSEYDGASTYANANGQFYLLTTLPADYYGDDLIISANGYGAENEYFYGYGLVSGLQVYLSPSPPNDNFENRIVLTGASTSYNGDNAGASYETGDPAPVFYGKSVWFSWTAPSSGTYTISVSSSFYFPSLGAFTGTQLSSLVRVNSDYGYADYASFNLTAASGQTYQIGVDDQDDVGGTYTLTIAP